MSIELVGLGALLVAIGGVYATVLWRRRLADAEIKREEASLKSIASYYDREANRLIRQRREMDGPRPFRTRYERSRRAETPRRRDDSMSSSVTTIDTSTDDAPVVQPDPASVHHDTAYFDGGHSGGGGGGADFSSSGSDTGGGDGGGSGSGD